MNTTLSENFYTRKIRISTLDIGIIKWSAACFGLAIGSYFSEIFRPYFVAFFVVALATGVWATFIWLKALKQSS